MGIKVCVAAACRNNAPAVEHCPLPAERGGPKDPSFSFSAPFKFINTINCLTCT